MAYTVLGIDLGGCMSGNSAYLYAKINGNGIDILDAFKEPRHKHHEPCLEFLTDACGRFSVDAIAIDAPLSIPVALSDPTLPQLPRSGEGEIVNPYLFRYTDYYIYEQFGLRPMPPAGDRIGRLSARAIALLHRLEYRFPELLIHGRRVPIYEVYPKQIAYSLGIGGYKKDPHSLFRRLHVSLETFDEHLLDALLCAYGAGRILEGHTTQPPAEALKEGWCFPVF